MDTRRNGKKIEDEMELHAPRAVPDGGWGWVICCSAFIVQFSILGFQNHLGLMYREHLAHFGESSLKTGWVTSLVFGNMFLFAPVTSALCEIFGCRKVGFIGGLLTVTGMLASSFAPNLYTLYFTFGLVYGIGTSMCYFPTLRTLPYWFSRNLALANGLAVTGSGMGTIVVGPILQTLLSATGWRKTMRIWSAVLMFPTLAALAYCVPERRNKKEETNLSKRKVKIVEFSVLKKPAFMILCLAMSIFMLGYTASLLHLPGYARDLKIDDGKSSNLIGILSAGSTVSRIFFGKLSDHPRVNRIYLYQVSFFFMGIVQALIPQVTNFLGFAMCMVSFGIFDGCIFVLLAIVVCDVVGIDKVSTGMGVKFFFMAITSFVGAPFAGWLTDISNSYSVAFYVAGGSAIFASVLLILVPYLMPRHAELQNRCQLIPTVIVEERVEGDVSVVNEKDYPLGGCPEVKTNDSRSGLILTDSSLLSSPNVGKSKSLLSVHCTIKAHNRSTLSVHLSQPKNTLTILSMEQPLRSSSLEVSCAVAGKEPSLLPPEVRLRGKSTPNLLAIERMIR